MAKFTQNTPDLTKVLQTKSGQENKDIWGYFREFADNCIRSLRNGLTFSDNFNCIVKQIDVTHNNISVIDLGGKTPTDIILSRVVATNIGCDDFGWWINGAGQLVVKVKFTGTPSGSIPVRLVILFS